MVSLNPVNEPVDENIIQPAQAVEDTFGEQYFPKQMSWYAPEGPQGWIEDGARKVREYPWLAIGAAIAAGLALGMLTRPLLRAGIAGLSMAMNGNDAAPDAQEPSNCGCTDEQ
jgi:hypothetical protein